MKTFSGCVQYIQINDERKTLENSVLKNGMETLVFGSNHRTNRFNGHCKVLESLHRVVIDVRRLKYASV